jgi:hypothetical protein
MWAPSHARCRSRWDRRVVRGGAIARSLTVALVWREGGRAKSGWGANRSVTVAARTIFP